MPDPKNIVLELEIAFLSGLGAEIWVLPVLWPPSWILTSGYNANCSNLQKWIGETPIHTPSIVFKHHFGVQAEISAALLRQSSKFSISIFIGRHLVLCRFQSQSTNVKYFLRLTFQTASKLIEWWLRYKSFNLGVVFSLQSTKNVIKIQLQHEG